MGLVELGVYGDYAGYADLTLDTPTTNGYEKVRLTSGRIDNNAVAFFGHAYCHWLAGAISYLTDWRIVTFDCDENGRSIPAHSAVVTPTGEVLDIFGVHPSPEALRDRLWNTTERGIRWRYQTNEELSRQMLDAEVGPWWWAHSFGPELTPALMHFARLCLQDAGYGELAEHKRHPETTTVTTLEHSTNPHGGQGGISMSTIDDVRSAMALITEKATYISGALAQVVGEFEDMKSLLTTTTHGSGAPEISQAMALLDQALGAAEEGQRATQQTGDLLDQWSATL